MTADYLDKKKVSQPSRRRFLVNSATLGGGLVVGFSFPGAFAGARNEVPPEAAVGYATDAATPAEPGLAHNAFIRIDQAGQVFFVMHKVEMGQGTFTSMSMLLAEELEVDPTTVKLLQAPPDNDRYADPLLGGQVTGGSTSVRGAWQPLRTAGATARMMLVSAAAQTWGVDEATCVAQNGTVTHQPSGRRLGYGELVEKAANLPAPKVVNLKNPKDYKLIGTPLKRLDAPEKINGTAIFGIDVRLPGMRVATVAASPVLGGKLVKADVAKALQVRGVRQVVRIEGAVAVLGDHMWAAKQGLAALDLEWSEGKYAGFSNADLVKDMATASEKPGAVARDDGNAMKTIASADRKLEAVYQLPFLAHATLEPVNCTIDLKDDQCDVWVGTQVPVLAHGALSEVTGLPLEKIRIHNHYIGGGFGRRLEVDFIVQAAAFAKQIKGPVKFIWTREEDIQQGMYRPYYYDRLGAALGEDGMPTAWMHRVTGSSIMSRFAPPLVKDGVDPDAVEGAKELLYAIPNIHVGYVRHEPPVPTAFWRGVGPTHNVFVVESFIDELAALADKDPFEYRRALLDKSPRAKAVLELAAEKAGWGKPVQGGADSRSGRGISVQHVFGSYMAQVAEVVVNKEGEVSVSRVVCAVDCGTVVNPDTVRAQIEGGVVFGLTAALFGNITYENGRVQQSNFHDYQMLRMNQSPTVEVYIVQSTDEPGGIGEPGTSAIGPAVANAVFAATGKRARKLPLEKAELRIA
jgi:isoquinoline 1-oxidoreductase beta subunit